MSSRLGGAHVPPSAGVRALHLATDTLRPLDLESARVTADLQSRTDRKYLARPEVVVALIAALSPRLRALEIDGARRFRYESIYFDTAELHSYLGVALGRRHRFKVRTRAYLDSGGCMLEVKTRSGRGETVKHRSPYDGADRRRLSAAGLAFVAECVGMPVEGELRPTLTTAYRRSTLVDMALGSRLTFDSGLACLSAAGSSVALSNHVLVETKSSGPPTPADRFLWASGCRPITLSKYCIGMAALDPTLPANKWNRTLRAYFDWTPDRSR